MQISLTLSAYLMRQYAFWLLAMFLALSSVVALFDTIELLRRASGREIDTLIVLQMALFKLPELLQQLMPFVVLFASILSFWRLSKANELVVARAAGVSVWQFLLPALLVAFLVGMFQVGVMNHLSATLKTQFEQLESRYLDRDQSALAVGETGLWLRQGSGQSQQVIHASSVAANGTRLEGVIVFLFAPPDRLIQRIDAATARLEIGRWVLERAYLSEPGGQTRYVGDFTLATDLTLEKIQESFAPPDTISFWQLPGFIASMEKAGFNASSHRLHYHTLLAVPFLLCAMVLIAASFSLKIGRRSSAGHLVAGGVGVGFLLFFLSNVVQALGLSETIPVLLAAWMPALVSLAMGLTALLHLEDG